MVGLISKGNRGQILLVQNKSSQPTRELLAENRWNINQILGTGVKQPYACLQYNVPDQEIMLLLKTITAMTPFILTNLVTPEICYERQEQGAEYEEVIDELTRDEGKFVEEVKDKGHYEPREEWDNSNIFGLFGLRGPGAKISYTVWVPNMVTEKKWVPKPVTHRSVATFVNIYKIRFDGTKDLIEKKQLRVVEQVL